MKMRDLPALLLVSLPLAACNGDATGLPAGQEAVTGRVVSIHDQVPVDGPVKLELEATGGQRELVFLPSFFTAEPRPQENWEIYERIQRLEIGDRVRVVGVRQGERLEIRALTRLPTP